MRIAVGRLGDLTVTPWACNASRIQLAYADGVESLPTTRWTKTLRVQLAAISVDECPAARNCSIRDINCW